MGKSGFQKTDPLPGSDTQVGYFARLIWPDLAPPNPHGPQSDLSFEMPYVRDSAWEAVKIAKTFLDALTKDNLPQRAEKVSYAGLTKMSAPHVIIPAPQIVALVAEDNVTIDMTDMQALEIGLIRGALGHESVIGRWKHDEAGVFSLMCSCGQLHRRIQDGDTTHDLIRAFYDHVWTTQNLLRVDQLPDGTYFDGLYEWDKDGTDWTPLMAPQGMPSRPSFDGLRRVLKSYEDV